DAEVKLYNEFKVIKEKVNELLNEKKYSESLDCFASLRPSIDAMFDSVMVMDKDEAIKNNRLGLLKQIYDTMLSICDLSKIVYK
ncbi:DALR anticodon-binding domain-containing protein, partial [Bacillus altitudinis]